ncbi:MAG: molecular chaperone [Desulfitobacterium sp.]
MLVKKKSNPMAQIATSRKEMYAYFGDLFLQEPNADRWPHQRQVLVAFLREAGFEPQLGETIPEGSSTFINDLRQEYYDCFFVPKSGRFVPPYESALLSYQDHKSRSFGSLNRPEASHVAQCYEAVGFKPSELNMFGPLKEIRFPDHAGFEFVFMAMLCQAEEAAREKDDNATAEEWQSLQAQFLQDHLAKWWSNFALALAKNAPGFYAQAAKAADIWIQSELKLIDDELNKRGD